jgi:hypothetical protein
MKVLPEHMTETERELPPVREALCYLPAWRGADYAMAAVAGEILRYDLREAMINVSLRMESCRLLGEKPYLDLDHDYKTQMFMIEKFSLVEREGIFCLGFWTAEGLQQRALFQGVSAAGLGYDKKFPPTPKLLEADQRAWKERKKNLAPDADFLGALGCVCIDCAPTFPGTSKTLALDGAADDLVRLFAAFNAAKISWPVIEQPKEAICIN